MRILISLFILAATFVTPLHSVEADIWVNGYTRSDGTHVRGHYRSNPDGNPYNNWSYPGNTNPHTGVTSGGNPETYLKNYYDSSYTPSRSTLITSYTDSYQSVSNGYKLFDTLYCNPGYYSKNNRCVKVPENGYAIGSTIYCNYGYTLTSSQCIKIKSNSSTYSNPIVSCPTNSSVSLTDSTKCSCNIGFQINKSKDGCVKITTRQNDQLCQATFGTNSKWNKKYSTENTPYCVCKDLYKWNNSETACIKI